MIIPGVDADISKFLSSLDKRQLDILQVEVDRWLEKVHEERIIALRAAIEAQLKEAGVTLDQVFAGHGGRRGRVVPIKYKNPDNPLETWTGRGRKPTWMQKLIRNGYVVEDFKIEVSDDV